jgi:glycosyltransferase involved in cell wall biosynthesis
MTSHWERHTGSVGADARHSVVLLRDPPDDRRRSMERYADALQAVVPQRSTWNVIPRAAMRKTYPHDRRPLPWGRAQWERLVAYPVAAARTRGDLWHICDHGYGHLAALLPPERVIVTCHDLMLLRSREVDVGLDARASTVARFRWSLSFLSKVAHVFCDSAATQHDLVRLTATPHERTSVVPLGIEDSFRPLEARSRRTIRSRLGFSDDDIVIMHVATNAAYKNPLAAVQCLRELRRRGFAAHLLRVGAPLKDIERPGMAFDDVERFIHEFRGLDDARLMELYNCADALIHPSYWEGFGWPPLEAMACGTPVVISTADSLLEIVGNAGPSAPATDIRGLVDGLVRVTSPDERHQWRHRVLDRASAFTWSGCVDTVTSRYDEVSARASHPRER